MREKVAKAKEKLTKADSRRGGEEGLGRRTAKAEAAAASAGQQDQIGDQIGGEQARERAEAPPLPVPMATFVI
jgi:hypothetical protein